MAQSGFGGIGAADEVIAEEEAPRSVPRHPAAPDIVSQMREMLQGQSDVLDDIRTKTEQYGTRLGNVEHAYVQLSGQLAQAEASLAQIRGYLNALGEHVNLIAQQVARNSRFAALELATRSRGPGEAAPAVVKNADAYLKFIEPEARESPAEPVERPH